MNNELLMDVIQKMASSVSKSHILADGAGVFIGDPSQLLPSDAKFPSLERELVDSDIRVLRGKEIICRIPPSVMKQYAASSDIKKIIDQNEQRYKNLCKNRLRFTQLVRDLRDQLDETQMAIELIGIDWDDNNELFQVGNGNIKEALNTIQQIIDTASSLAQCLEGSSTPGSGQPVQNNDVPQVVYASRVSHRGLLFRDPVPCDWESGENCWIDPYGDFEIKQLGQVLSPDSGYVDFSAPTEDEVRVWIQGVQAVQSLLRTVVQD